MREWLESIVKYYVCGLFATAYIFMLFEGIEAPPLFVACLVSSLNVLGFSVVYSKVVRK